MQWYSNKEINLKMFSAAWRPFRLNVCRQSLVGLVSAYIVISIDVYQSVVRNKDNPVGNTSNSLGTVHNLPTWTKCRGSVATIPWINNREISPWTSFFNEKSFQYTQRFQIFFSFGRGCMSRMSSHNQNHRWPYFGIIWCHCAIWLI